MLKKYIQNIVACASVGFIGLSLAACSNNSDENAENTISVIDIALSDIDGVETCSISADTVSAGAVTFNVTNESAPSITEVELLYNQRILGEKENLAPGLNTVSFTLNLDGGDYQIYCANADEGEYLDLKVEGKAAERSGTTYEILQQGVLDYASYITNQIALLAEYTGYLNDAVQSGDIQAAKEAYVAARPYYERAESAVDGFLVPGTTDPEDNSTNLDYLIDMRESNLDEEAGWHGFHAIEKALWADAEITDETKELAQELFDNVTLLNEEVIPTFADDLTPEDLANGAAGLLEEVSATKITGEENLYAHTDLVDFAANVEGAHQAYAALRDGLLEIDSDLVSEIDEQFKDLEALLKNYKNDSNLGGYEYYTDALKGSDGKTLQDALDPLFENIASLAEKVVLA